MNVSRWSLNQLLMLLGTGVLTVFLLPLCIYFVFSVVHLTERTLEENSQSTARILASQVIDQILTGDRLSLLDAIEKVTLTNKNITYVCIEDAKGEIISHTFKNGFPSGLEKIWNKKKPIVKFRTDDGPILDVSAPIMNGQLGSIHVGFSRKYSLESLTHLVIVLGVGLTGTLLLIFAGTWFVSVKVSKPIQILEKVVSKFSPEKKSDWGIEIKGTREVVSLAHGFKEMSLRLNTLEHERTVIQAKMIHAERLSALGELAAGLTHEIRNPLDGMLECIRYLEAEPMKSKRQEKFLPMIHEGLQRINEIMENMLLFARSGNITKEEICLTADIIDTLEIMLQGQLKSRNIKLTWHKPGTCTCLCNKPSMVQSLLNLVLNAIEAVKDKKAPEILIEAKCDSEWVYILVEDNGNGIPSGLENKIFDMFYTTKSAGRGTGLGLPISRQLIRAAGGDLVLASHTSSLSGACFEIRIPRVYKKDCCNG